MSGDNFRREVQKLRRRVGDNDAPKHYCYHCGQPLRGAHHAKLVAERVLEESKQAREQFIATIEAIAERQIEATARERARREAEMVARERVVEVVGADVRPEQETQERFRPVDPVLDALRRRRLERERAERAARESVQPTVVNNDGGTEDDGS